MSELSGGGGATFFFGEEAVPLTDPEGVWGTKDDEDAENVEKEEVGAVLAETGVEGAALVGEGAMYLVI